MISRPRQRRLRAALPAALAVTLACGNGLQAVPAEPAAALDLARYAGRWYVIARAPADEPNQRAAYFEYRPRADGTLEQIYSAREESFDAEPETDEHTARVDPEQPSRWQVRTGWLSSHEQWVLYVSPDYRFAIAGVPARREAWILAREPVIPEWTYAGLLVRLAKRGYDVSRVRRVAQEREQVGRPGFE